jgi:lysine decarboxylase
LRAVFNGFVYLNKGKKLKNFLVEHASKKPVSFHMPGHKGAGFYKKFGYDDFINNFFDFDITEIEGADNLFQREGIIKAVSEKYARLYSAKESFLLINGTSCGLISAILATVPRGAKLIMARNSHKSIFNALTLGDITPIYAYPKIINEWDISGEITSEEIEKLLFANPDAEAVILPSPNYYGICSDVEKISEVVHRFGKILIVDQAHGAHLNFFNEFEKEGFPLAAERCGADIVVNSTHKTLASLTQSAVLNVCSDRIDIDTLEDKLQMMESTSPSYILMGSLDINGSILEEHGQKLIAEWNEHLKYFYEESKEIEGLRVMTNLANFDKTKINIDMSKKGYSGRQLEKALVEKYGIFAELNTGNILMLMTGIGNIRGDYQVLLKALKELSYKPFVASELTEKFDMPKSKLLEAEGKICLRAIIPYPPGIPLVCPGEIITKAHVEILYDMLMNGEKVLGLKNKGEIAFK